jgi:hypothetical protein
MGKAGLNTPVEEDRKASSAGSSIKDATDGQASAIGRSIPLANIWDSGKPTQGLGPVQ